MNHEITVNSKYCKTYKTKANLRKALSKIHDDIHFDYIIVVTEGGRFSPIISLDPELAHQMTRFAQHGRKTI